VVIALAVVAPAAFLLWGATQPWAANHFGYALSGPNGRPDHITHGGLRYDNLSGAANRLTQADLQAENLWPLKQVGTIPTLFGTSHAIYALANDPGAIGVSAGYTPLDLYVSTGDGADRLYERGGGP
jgi:hypothetical protein